MVKEKSGYSVNRFRGHYEHNIDAKGRVSVPVKFRDVLTEKYDANLMVTCLNQCLIAYPMDEWETLEEKLSQLPEFKGDVNRFLRIFSAGAVECPIDKQGRILVPNTLRKRAKLDKELVFVGMLDRFEIWSKELWDKELEKAGEEDYGEILSDFGI